jgi:hypothetical protein
MPRLIRQVLDASDLPIAELCAARLDGEVYSVDECFAAVDEVHTRVVRALAVSTIAPNGAIAELATAIWIYGVSASPPKRHRFCRDVAKRARTPQSNRYIVRECIVRQGDVQQIAGLPVMTPLRTAADLLRISPKFGVEEARVLSELFELGGVSLADCLSKLTARPATGGTNRALERLREWFPAC